MAYRGIEELFYFAGIGCNPADPHQLCDSRFRCHIVGFQDTQVGFQAVAHMIYDQVAALVGYLCGHDDGDRKSVV